MVKAAFFAILLVVTPSFVTAQVVINEIAWMGTPVEGVEPGQWWRYEWIELHNITGSSVVLNGWMVELYRSELDWRVPLAGTIAPNGYFLVTASDKIKNFDVNYANLSGKFVNTGQRVVTRNALGAVVEEIGGREGWFGGDNETKQSMERRDPLRPGQDAESWGTSAEAGGTPKAQNSIFGLPKPSELAARAGQDLALARPAKKDSFESSFGDMFWNPAFLKALALAVVSSAAILFLKRWLRRPPYRLVEQADR